MEIAVSDEVVVRAHMNVGGYGGAAMRGSPEGTFVAVKLGVRFAAALETAEPQPLPCAF